MAATPLSPGNERELAALRARAFGPDADISRDPRALARLTELEGMARPDASPPASVKAPESAVRSSAEDAASLAFAGSRALSAAADASEDAGHASAPKPMRPWWRRVPVSILVAGAAVLGLGIGLAAPGLLPPHPHAVLHTVPSEGRGPTFSNYGVRAGSPTRYENFRDLEVWSARTTDGAVCVLVISADTTWTRAGCAPRPLDPMAEVSPYPIIREIEGLDLPIGSLVRFILHEGAVQVWIDRNRERT